MYNENETNVHEEYPIFASCTNIPTVESYSEKIINKSIIEKSTAELRKSLKVVDQGEKQTGNSIVDGVFGSFRVYEISLTDEKNNEKIKCFRRYSNFDKLDVVLRENFPYIIIPTLPPKGPLLKNYTSDVEFFTNREKGLNFYINFLLQNKVLSSSNYYKKFINDPEFDDKFFDSCHPPNKFMNCEKKKSSIKGQILNLFGIFKKEEVESKKESHEEKRIEELLLFYKKIINFVEEFIKTINGTIKNFKTASSNYDELAMNFFYLRDVELERFIVEKEDFNKYNKALKGISKINRNYGLNFEETLLVNNTNFHSLLKGLVESITNWKSFNNKLKEIKEEFHNKDLSSAQEIKSEIEEAEDYRDIFYTNLGDEIKEFNSKHQFFLFNSIQEFKNLFINLSLHESNLLKEEDKYQNSYL